MVSSLAPHDQNPLDRVQDLKQLWAGGEARRPRTQGFRGTPWARGQVYELPHDDPLPLHV